eukprot:gene4270-5343_t
MLSIERKRTEKVDLIKPLKKYIKDQFGSEEANNHDSQIHALNQLRDDIRNLQDKTDTSKDMIWRYYSTLSSLEIRFPISESNVRISFPWTDSFRQKKVSLYSIYYERSAVLFNYGSIVSQIGASQNRTTIEGIKKACNYFQTAAGVFSALREYISKHPECFASQDFCADSLDMLHVLMLAQAQECIFEKAALDNLSDAIQSKLAAQTFDYYEAASLLLNSNNLKNLVDRYWAMTALVKSLMYQAIAGYKYAQTLEVGFKFGEQLARLSIVIEKLNQAKVNLPKSAQPELRTFVEKYSNVIVKYHESAEKDNDTIYHDVVPPAHKLQPLEKKGLAKALPLPELTFVDPFTSLIPFSVKEDAAIYNEQKDTLLKKELENIEFHNQSAKASLLSMGLPGSIEALEIGIPKALQEKMDLVKSEKAIENITSLLENLQQLSDEDNSICVAAGEVLKHEEKMDNDMRTQYQSAWHRTPSYTLTSNLQQDLAKFTTNLQHSTKSDSFIRKKFEDNKALIAALESQDEVIALLPSNLFPVTQIPEIATLTVLLNDLDNLMANRESISEKLKTQCKKDDITLKLLSPAKDKNQIYAEEIQKYEPLQMSLNESFLKQQTLIENIRKENEKFTSSKSKQGNQREEILQKFANAFKVYNELKSNLDEGMQFYANFQEILVKYKRKCEDFVNEREKERIELERQIKSGVNPYSPTPTAPPTYHQQLPPQHNQPPQYPPPQPTGSQQPPYFSNRPPTYTPQPNAPNSYPFNGGQPPPYQPPTSFNAPPPSFQAPPPYGKPPPYYK